MTEVNVYPERGQGKLGSFLNPAYGLGMTAASWGDMSPQINANGRKFSRFTSVDHERHEKTRNCHPDAR